MAASTRLHGTVSKCREGIWLSSRSGFVKPSSEALENLMDDCLVLG